MSFGALPDGTTLFLDLDGVMADFDGGFPAKFGFDHRDVPDDVMWDAIHKDGKFFRELPPCADALDFFARIEHLRPVILTACPSGDRFADVAEQKRAWVRIHLGARVPLVFTPGGKTKSLYMHRYGDILVDDFESNVRRWKKAGGIGIWHTGDFADTLYKLTGEPWQTSHPASDTNHVLSAGPVTTSDDTTMDTASASAAATTNQGVMPGFADHPSPAVLYPCL